MVFAVWFDYTPKSSTTGTTSNIEVLESSSRCTTGWDAPSLHNMSPFTSPRLACHLYSKNHLLSTLSSIGILLPGLGALRLATLVVLIPMLIIHSFTKAPSLIVPVSTHPAPSNQGILIYIWIGYPCLRVFLHSSWSRSFIPRPGITTPFALLKSFFPDQHRTNCYGTFIYAHLCLRLQSLLHPTRPCLP